MLCQFCGFLSSYRLKFFYCFSLKNLRPTPTHLFDKFHKSIFSHLDHKEPHGLRITLFQNLPRTSSHFRKFFTHNGALSCSQNTLSTGFWCQSFTLFDWLSFEKTDHSVLGLSFLFIFHKNQLHGPYHWWCTLFLELDQNQSQGLLHG